MDGPDGDRDRDGRGGRDRDGKGGKDGPGKGGKGGKDGKGKKMMKKMSGKKGPKRRRRFGKKFGKAEVLVTVIVVLSLLLVGVSCAYYKKSKETTAMMPHVAPAVYELPNTSTVQSTHNDNTMTADKNQMA